MSFNYEYQNSSYIKNVIFYSKMKGFTLALLYSVSISVIGGTFIVGWHIGLFNTPSQV
jgi:uncharacterized membrane protein